MDKDDIELIKALVPLAWPIVVLVAAFAFRDQVRDVIKRALKLPGGIELQAPGQTQTTQAPDSKKALVAAMPPPSEAIAKGVEQLEAALKQLPEHEREPRLVRSLALSELIVYLERTYRAIFGSQIRLAKLVYESGSFPVSDARKVYDAAAAANPEFYKDVPFDRWLRFLDTAANLVKLEADTLKPTSLSREFFIYLTEMRLPDWKPF